MTRSKKRILMVTWGPFNVASSRVRAYQYVPYLEQRGWQNHIVAINPTPFKLLGQSMNNRYKYLPLFSPMLSKFYTAYSRVYRTWNLERVRRLLPKFDILYVQKVLLDDTSRNFVESLGRPVVFDFDDAINTLLERRQEFDAMLKLADAVVTTNRGAISYARTFCANVVQIVGPIDTKRYRPMQHKSHNSDVIIGWLGSPYTAPELVEILDSIIEVLSSRSRTKLYAVGAGCLPTSMKNIIALPWSYESELELLAQFDVGIMPLQNTAWNRGKGGYKLLQYMSSGIPAIASPIGINSDIIDHMKNGILASTELAWKHALIKLIDTPSMRRRIGSQARDKVTREYSLDVGASKLSTTLASLV